MSSSIRWDRAALLIGAGFSHELGMPLVWELTQNLKEWLTPEKLEEFNADWRRRNVGHSAAVIRATQELLANPALHYEQIIGNLQSLGDKHGNLAGWITDVVCQILFLRHKDNLRKLWGNARFYSGLAALASRASPLWIFSLNHDIVTEMIADQHGVAWTTGFPADRVSFPVSNVLPGARKDVAFLSLSGERMTTGTLEFRDEGINLVKLHGSLDFFRYNNGKGFLTLPPDPSGLARVESLATLYEDMHYEEQGQRIRVARELVVSDVEGVMQFLRHTLLAGTDKFNGRRGNSAPVELLRLFETKLITFSELVAIGYGFGDAHINRIVIDWLAADAERRLILVGGPTLAAVPPALREVADRVCLHSQHATAFLDEEANIVRSGREALELRMLRASRAIGSKEEAAAALKDARQAHIQTVVKRLAQMGLRTISETSDLHKLADQLTGGFDEMMEETFTLFVEALEKRATERLEALGSTGRDQVGDVNSELACHLPEPFQGGALPAGHDLPEVGARDVGAIGEVGERDLSSVRQLSDVPCDPPVDLVHVAPLDAATVGLPRFSGVRYNGVSTAGLVGGTPMETTSDDAGRERTLFQGSPAFIYDVSQVLWGFITAGILLLVYWLRSKTTRVEVTTQRVRIQSGILSRVKQDIELFRVDDITYEQPIGMRLLGYGRLRLRTTDRSTPVFTIEGLKGLEAVGEQLRESCFKERERRRVGVLAHA